MVKKETGHPMCVLSKFRKELEANPKMKKVEKIELIRELDARCINEGKVSKGGGGNPEKLREIHAKAKELDFWNLRKEALRGE